MELIHLATGHAFEALGAIAIVASLLFTAVELRHFVQAQRVANQLAITRQHREIWTEIFRHSDLTRILDAAADLSVEAVTPKETFFVNFLILHLDSVFKASRVKMFVPAQALPKDIAWFLSLPVPHEVWKTARMFQDPDFAEFVESALSEGGSNHETK